jgi:hypothetical protein
VLSRRADYVTDEDNDNGNMMLLPDTVFVKALDTELHDLLAEATMKDNLVTDMLQVLKHRGTLLHKLAPEDWKFNDRDLCLKNRCYIPQDDKLRREIIQKYHISIATGHPRQFQMLELI